MPSFCSFDDALRQTEGMKRHLLLGNGFSIALFADRFRYGSLLEETDFSTSPELRAAFDALETVDFETVIHALTQAAALLSIYSPTPELGERISTHAETLKDLLVRAIAGRHPDRPSDISNDQYAACRRFLSHFVGEGRVHQEGGKTKDRRGHVYSLNYDLLLYWTLLHEEPFMIEEELKHDDGFRAPDDPDAPYVTWAAESAANEQNIHFLHGGLHLFDNGPELEKRCWERSGGIPLVDQIRTALNEGRFPLFVSEGHTDGKLSRIRHSGYLQRSLRSFANIGDALFVFGHSFAANDEHILRLIDKGKMRHLFASLYGDRNSSINRTIIARAERMIASRHDRRPLDVGFYNAAEAQVWSAS